MAPTKAGEASAPSSVALVASDAPRATTPRTSGMSSSPHRRAHRRHGLHHFGDGSFW